jgi:hypothetical protein
LMVSNPITIASHASISEAIELMKVNSIRHLCPGGLSDAGGFKTGIDPIHARRFEFKRFDDQGAHHGAPG